MSLSTLLSLWDVSTEIRKRAQQCVTTLESFEEEHGDIEPWFILDLPRLRYVAFDYLISVTNQEELIALAQKESLRFAAFRFQTEWKTPARFILDFIEASPVIVGDDQTCTGCQEATYDYAFTNDETTIRISDNEIAILGDLFPGMDEVWLALAEKGVTTCHLRSELNPYSLLGADRIGGCLQSIDIVNTVPAKIFKDILEQTLGLKYLLENTPMEVYTTQILPYAEEIRENNALDEVMNSLMRNLIKEKSSYPQVKSFLPVPFNVRNIKHYPMIFPNAVTITFTMSSIKKFQEEYSDIDSKFYGKNLKLSDSSDLLLFEKIYVYDDLQRGDNYTLEADNNIYTMAFLDPAVQEKIKIVPIE
jgi:hypothetical protein